MSLQLLAAEGWTLKASTPRCSSQDLGAACTAGTASPETEPQLFAANFPGDHQGVTRYELYDPFGRPGRIVAPDGFVSTATYKGVREVERTVKVVRRSACSRTPSGPSVTTRSAGSSP